MAHSHSPAASFFSDFHLTPDRNFDVNLNYDEFDDFLDYRVDEALLDQELKREISVSTQAQEGSDDDVVIEEGSSPWSPGQSMLNRQTPPLVDLTESPPQVRRGPYTGYFNDHTTLRYNPDLSQRSAPEASSSMIPPRRQPPRRASTTPARSLDSTTRPVSQNAARPPRKRRRADPNSAQTTRAPQPIEAEDVVDLESEERTGKRRRTGRGSERQNQGNAQTRAVEVEEEVEAIDLTEVNDASGLSKALSKQRQDAVLSQIHTGSTDGDEGRTILTSYKCPICMDVLEDATSTVCGHLFCHKCIMDTLRFSEIQHADDSVGKPKGTCPVCRKPLARNDKQDKSRTLIPLGLKLSLSTKSKGKGKEVARDAIQEFTTL